MIDDLLGQFFHWLGEALGMGKGRGPLIFGWVLLLITVGFMIFIFATEVL